MVTLWRCFLQASLAQVSSSNPTVTLVQLPNGQTVQVHGVIQAAQPSVIQSPQVQTVQVREAYNYICYIVRDSCLPCCDVLYLVLSSFVFHVAHFAKLICFLK